MADSPSLSDHAGSFGRAAAVYERGRPSYPAEAVDWLVPAGATRVLDLGAGTGKLTRDLVGRGLDVVAVEPLEGMRSELSRILPTTQVLAGSAEAIPLAGESVDAVLVAQAWHWVDPARAVPEVARVLRPGGTLGLLWNVRDEREPWVAALGDLIHRHGFSEERSQDPPVGAPFGPGERRDVPWRHSLTPDELLAMVASRSYFILLPPDQQEAVLSDVRRLMVSHPGLAGREIVMPYVTRCSRFVTPSPRS